MEYNRIDFSDINISPKNKKQLEENIEHKINKLIKSNNEEYKSLSFHLVHALKWLRDSKIDLPNIDGKEYYRLGYYITNDNVTVYNVQIWQSYYDDVDILKRIFMSSSDDDLDNDENTIIISSNKN